MEEASLAKITRKYFFKVLIWFLLIEIVCGIGTICFYANKLDSVGSKITETATVINSLMIGLIIVNILACVIPPLLATRKIKKKYVINADNKMKVFRNVVIILCIFAVLLIGIHAGIKSAVYKPALESTDLTEQEVKDGLKDIEEFAEEQDLDTDEVKELSKFFRLADVYVLDGLVLVVMMGVEYLLIVKKEQQA